MPDRVPIIAVMGSLTPWVDQDVIPLSADGTAYTVDKVHLFTDPDPAGAEITVDFRNEAAGAGDGITVTIAAGQQVGEASGTLTLDGTQNLYQRITSASGSFGLSGWFSLGLGATPATGTALTTLTRVKLELGIDTANVDTLLGLLIDGVTERFQQETKRRLVQTAISAEKHDGNGWRNTLFADEYPVTSAGLVVLEDGVTLVEGTDFELEPGNGGLYRTSGGAAIVWASGYRNLSLTYSGGYATIPAGLVSAATAQVCHEYHQTNPGGARRGLASVAREAGGSTTYVAGDLLKASEAAIARYKRR